MTEDNHVFGMLATPDNLRKIANALAETIIVNSGGSPSDGNKADARVMITDVVTAFLRHAATAIGNRRA